LNRSKGNSPAADCGHQLKNWWLQSFFPIGAKMQIKSPYVADAIWFLMKPLEWLFLIALYLCDTKPENRIAVQYPHAPLPDHQ